MPADTPIYAQAEIEREKEGEKKSSQEPDTEKVTEKKEETEWETEAVTEAEKEPEIETEKIMEDEEEPEPETEEATETEKETEAETEEETELEIEEETDPETEEVTEAEEERETETEEVTEAEEETDPETEEVTEVEAETEAETEAVTEVQKETESITAEIEDSASSSSTWDSSWYIPGDYRFTQVDKQYVLIEGGESAPVYEEPDPGAECIGMIPYFGLAYVLEEDENGWAYIESGEVRGFVEMKYLSASSYATEMVELIGEDALPTGDRLCEKADNAAFTHTHTTVYEVVAKKQYAITIYAGAVYEYRNLASRAIGQVNSGTLVYVLESSDGWAYVESDDVRGFIPAEYLVTGTAAEGIVDNVGEGELSLAEMEIPPEENRSCYYTLTSIKTAAENVGEEIAQYAVSFVGRLPYVWGGTSLQLGTDCSGFVQSVYAAFGISLPRLAQEQGASGQVVDSIAEAKPGDVVYYSSGPHVGIYIGNGKVVQCSGNSGNTAGNPGAGPTISQVDYMPITSIRRYAMVQANSSSGGNARKDTTVYTQDQMELIWAIVAQEDNGSYEGALAVISSAMNRSESAKWGYCGSNALDQLTAPGQYCYSNDDYWRPRLNGNVPEYVKQAVYDCLELGIRNHHYTSFRSRRGSVTGPDAVQIGGNWFFDT